MIAAAAAATATCLVPIGAGADFGSQLNAYAQRSVQIVALAAARRDQVLRNLIARNAEFSLGAGDVGRPLGHGVEGARAMANDLHAATFEYHGWSGIPMTRDPCGPQEVEIEFVTTDGTDSADIKFHYDGGILQSAAGWRGYRVWGTVQVDH